MVMQIVPFCLITLLSTDTMCSGKTLQLIFICCEWKEDQENGFRTGGVQLLLGKGRSKCTNRKQTFGPPKNCRFLFWKAFQNAKNSKNAFEYTEF